MVFVWNPTRPRKSKQPSQFWLGFEWYLYEILLDHANRCNLSKFDLSEIIFVWAPSKPRKKKQPSQFGQVFERSLSEILLNQEIEAPFSNLLVFEWSLYGILLDHANRSNLFKFYLLLNGFCMKSYQTTQIEATLTILNRFLMVFVWNPTRICKSKPLCQFWLVFEWFLYEILLEQANRGNLLNFVPFLNGFFMKSY